MDSDKLEKIIDVVLEDLQTSRKFYICDDITLRAEVKNALNVASTVLPEHRQFFHSLLSDIELDRDRYQRFTKHDAISAFEHIRQIIEVEKRGFHFIFENNIVSNRDNIVLTSGIVTTYASTGSNIVSKAEQYPDSPILISGASDFKTKWSDMINEFDKRLREGDDALNRYNEAIRKQERATRIVNLIGTANIFMKTKRKAVLFREDIPKIIDELHTSCRDENHFVTKICTLQQLFEVSLDPLRKLVQEPNGLRSIRLVEKWLEENKISYDSSMIRTWLHINSLRNMFPVHPEPPKELFEILTFFDTTFPPNHALLWDKILQKFAQSLEEWNRILESI